MFSGRAIAHAVGARHVVTRRRSDPCSIAHFSVLSCRNNRYSCRLGSVKRERCVTVGSVSGPGQSSSNSSSKTQEVPDSIEMSRETESVSDSGQSSSNSSSKTQEMPRETEVNAVSQSSVDEVNKVSQIGESVQLLQIYWRVSWVFVADTQLDLHSRTLMNLLTGDAVH
jgi:hypothetical protein